MRKYHNADSVLLAEWCGCGDKAARKADMRRCICAVLTVLAIYGSGAAWFYGFKREPERLVGSPSAIMLEFAAEPTAVAAQAVAENVQAARMPAPSLPQAEREAAKPAPQAEPAPAVPPAQSDFTAADRQNVPAHRPKTETKPDKSKEQRRERHWAKAAKNIERTRKPDNVRQKSAAPAIAARPGKNFAAAKNSAEEGFNGQSEKSWADLVYRKIQNTARRLQRQLPGGRGVAYIAFRYNGAGEIELANIARSSGNARFDDLALRIVEQASPLPAPPAAGRKTIPVRIN